MSAAERIERGRDEASFADVFTDEEHDHAAESARDGIGHVEAAAIEKDYAAPKRKGRAKDGRRAIIAEGAAVEGDSSEAPNGATAKAGAPATARTVVSGRKSGTDDSSAIHANKGSGALHAAARSVADEMSSEDDTDALAGAQGGLRGAGYLGRRVAARTAHASQVPVRTEEKGWSRSATKEQVRRASHRRSTKALASSSLPQSSAAMTQSAASAKAGFAAKIAAAVSSALPGAAGAVAVAAALAAVCAVIVAVLSFSWFWDEANKKKSAVDLPPGCEALRGDVEDACSEVFGNADWSDMVLAIMAAESGGDLNVVAAGGATYVHCVGGCGTPLSSVRQDVMQASECGYGGIIVHGATKGNGVTCCPSVGAWPYESVGASTARASIYAGTLYLRDGLEMWSGYLGEIGPGDVGKLALVAQGYNYNMSSWFSWCKARGITEYSLDASEQFQETLPAGYKGTANHAQKVMAYYPYGRGSSSGTEDQATLALMASTHATNDIYYQQWCARWTNDMYELVFGPGTCSRYSSAWLDWRANGVSSDMDDVPLGAAVYASGWGYPGMGNENPYGHVGIYVGDGQVADYSGVHDLKTWASQQNALCNGHVGWLGWGWISGDDLTKH